jgi:hypothetical protein
MRYKQIAATGLALLCASAISGFAQTCKLPESEVRKFWVMAAGRTPEEKARTAEALIRAQCELRYGTTSDRPATPLPENLQKLSR